MENTESSIQNPLPEENQQTDFSLIQLFEQIGSMLQYLLSKWLWITGIGLLTGCLGWWYSSTKKPTYEAEITFALDEESNPKKPTALSELSYQLGLETAPDKGNEFFSNITNIAELLKSRFLIEQTLKDSVVLDKKKIVYMDFLLDSLKLRNKWIQQAEYQKMNWADSSKSKAENLFRNQKLEQATDYLIGQCIKLNNKTNGSSIYSVKCVSQHEAFSKYFVEALLSNVKKYYTLIKTERAQNNLEFIQKRTDSIRKVYESALYGRASFMDAHMNPARQVSIVANESKSTDIQILRSSYIDLNRALELAKGELLKTTPLFQFLDTPRLPLKKKSSNGLLYFMAFLMAGIVGTTLFFLLRKIYRKIMGTDTDGYAEEMYDYYEYPDPQYPS